ncbi:MAG: glycosyltransferase family 4 protein [bacterium]|nr:glycosyltransferase family 4 protein [bacterium]
MTYPSFHLLTFDYPPRVGGAARYHGAVADALGGDGCTVEVCNPTVRWTTLIPKALRLDPRTHLIVGEILPLGTVAWTRARTFRGAYSVICHGLDLANALRTPRKRWLAARILRGATRVIVNSAATAGLARRVGASSEQVVIVSPPLGPIASRAGIARSAARDALGVGDVPLVLSVGRLIPRKGMESLIDAMVRVRQHVPRAHLTIVGSGPLAQTLVAHAERVRVPCVVTTADDAALAQWYAAADVFAMLPEERADGDIEGFGIVYIEAGAFGLPVVGTQSGGVPDAVVHGTTGLLVAPGDPLAAAQAITSLLEDHHRARALGTVGCTRALSQFGPRAFAASLRAALSVVL